MKNNKSIQKIKNWFNYKLTYSKKKLILNNLELFIIYKIYKKIKNYSKNFFIFFFFFNNLVFIWKKRIKLGLRKLEKLKRELVRIGKFTFKK
jgi:hypothetical protein